MALYHLSVKMISRATGRSAVAAAAYRAGAALEDQRLQRTHDFTRKTGVIYSEIILPNPAPERFGDRSVLWNAVEAAEKRKDAQLAREVEFAIPREMTPAQGIALARDFVQAQFVARGMIADLNVHWDQGADGLAKPHAHVMLTTRRVNADGFGAKDRSWNDKALLCQWREHWADLVNAHLAALDLDLRVDHRSFAAQGIALEPQNKIGPAGMRRGLRGDAAERVAEHQAIARRNGVLLAQDPALALAILTKQHSTFTRQDLARFVHRHTADAEQFRVVLAGIEASSELVRLGDDARGRQRFSTRSMVATEQRLVETALSLGRRQSHAVSLPVRQAAMRSSSLGQEQALAVGEVTKARALSVVTGYAGTGKSTMLMAAREAWEQAGYCVRGAALSGIAAEGLEVGSGIVSRTLASWEYGWARGQDVLAAGDVLVVDEAGMVGSCQMERVLSAVQAAGAKVVLVGDPEQVQAIDAGGAFRAVVERVGSAEITTVRRQQVAWQAEATQELATGRTIAALERYAAAGHVHGHDTLEAAREAVVAAWDGAQQVHPGKTSLMVAHRRVDVRALNEAARRLRQERGALDPDVEMTVLTTLGERCFVHEDRVYFLRNDRALGVKNGTLGTVRGLFGADEARKVLVIQLDGPDGPGTGRKVDVRLWEYDALDHGYAATIHKAQGVTVDQVQLLATASMDRHSAYVALSRHRERVDLHWAQDDLGGPAGVRAKLSRERLKDTTLDYPQVVAQGREDMRARLAQHQADQRRVQEGRAAFRAAWQKDRLDQEHQRCASGWLEAWERAWCAWQEVMERCEGEPSDTAQKRERLMAQMRGLMDGSASAWRGAVRDQLAVVVQGESRRVLEDVLKSAQPVGALDNTLQQQQEEVMRYSMIIKKRQEQAREIRSERAPEMVRKPTRRRTQERDYAPGLSPW
ncbi:Ti-type conjugative transfer relaxase TraA [Neokomagataea anthophila]|uniref:Ti-type conjugative transfer relaxase TraA n=1 Tax=Neokomagataea anthophila TaxID=2826925 RepID=A0ABS5E9V8_9PROT|nr:Ti-type conjugative transfer relaxase TraA [Neokomagataea anthophila]MBR0560685.1 Ti-type conjugative transfer relaxase TraA [Neokomagataea anthophila]